RQAVEMMVCGKPGKRWCCFPPFPQTLEIDEADSHIPTATTMTRMNQISSKPGPLRDTHSEGKVTTSGLATTQEELDQTPGESLTACPRLLLAAHWMQFSECPGSFSDSSSAADGIDFLASPGKIPGGHKLSTVLTSEACCRRPRPVSRSDVNSMLV